MKKIILIALGLLMAVNLHAQRVDLGVKLGANFSNINDAAHLRFKSKTGMVAGAFISIGNERFAFQPEVLYSQQGAKTDFGNFDLDYINVPVLLKLYLIERVLNIQAGPQFGFMTDQKLKDQLEAKDRDITGVIGLGIDLPIGFRIDGRYNFGLTEVTQEAGGKNGVFSLAIGYSFL